MGVIEKSNTYTYGDLSIGQRISEIMEERGSSYSLRAFGGRIGISKDMLGRMISGERHMTPSELEKIAAGFKISVERLKQEDTKDDLAELRQLLRSRVNPKRAFGLAQGIAAVALGSTERCVAYNLLGQAYFLIGDTNEAHQAWLQALTYAEKIEHRYGDAGPLYAVLNNLTVTLTERKEFSKLSEILNRIEPVFEADMERMGSIMYSRATIARYFLENELEGQFIYRSLECLMQTNFKDKIGRAQVNAADFEFRGKNYVRARDLLEQAMVNLADEAGFFKVAVKEYVKVLLKLGDIKNAIKLIESNSDDLDGYPDLKSRFQFLLVYAKQDIAEAENLISDPSTDRLIHRLTCEFLMSHYQSLGDAHSFMKYYKLAKSIHSPSSDLLDEGDL
ncbi:helix-turn-helix transcriptional regulator [Tumebacillus sp. DT12]|uniref:Helix-turn-helix transcriptional regulator n=1 Tax=Tumebacillus lacus TaxID=2995335 RepID=A0ABT3WYD6_9BACL|nr:helix-turn-helix transcriptional regulator [Tumebacillus lacus]MCX7569670.1 helix-turn-helix transcriptional regulator [Tumebacillus lacus]